MKPIDLLSPKQKFVFLLTSAVFAIITDNRYFMGGYFLFSVFLFLTAGISSGKIKIWFAAILLMWWGTILSQGLFYAKMPRQIYFTIFSKDVFLIGPLTGGLHLYKEGIEHGLIQAMRFGITLTIGLLICFTTETKDMLRAAIQLKIPYNLGFMVTVGIRFIPVIINEVKTVLNAQRMRGHTPLKSGFIKPIKTAKTILVPILVNSIRRSQALSLSVESRNFGNSETFYFPKAKGENLITETVLKAFIFLIFSFAVMKVLYILYVSNFFYSSSLRLLYSLTEKYL